jgi:alpha-beta hydrolase superfamily lysophospholipase
MQTGDFTFGAEDGTPIAVYRWLPDEGSPARAVVQIAHGMAEHAARYARFAEVLCAGGFAVYANDHRGHGRTAGAIEQVGYIADTDGWARVVGDLHRLTGIIREKHAGRPLFLFGHSMGSLLARSYIPLHGSELSGVILSGTPVDPGIMGHVGLAVARLVSFLKGRRTPSPLLNRLSFGKFNRPFKPNRTEFDWLSRDAEEVDRYVADPYCGGVFSAGFFMDLLTGIHALADPEALRRIPRNLPILLLSGDRDPCGGMGAGVRSVAAEYRGAGIADLTFKLYPQARHELLNETNREEVFADILSWMNQRLGGP